MSTCDPNPDEITGPGVESSGNCPVAPASGMSRPSGAAVPDPGREDVGLPAAGGPAIGDTDVLMSPQALMDVARSFDRNHVRYLIVGGLAVIAHGFTRLTQDVDVIIDFGEENDTRAVRALKQLGYQSRVPEPMEAFTQAEKRQAWARDKDMVVFTVWKHQQGYINELDLFLSIPFDFDAAYRNALWKAADQAGEVLVPFVDLDNLIRMKRQAGRPKDIEDIRNLLANRFTP